MSDLIAAVYRIQNTVTRDCYVGSSINLERRWTVHRSELRCGSHPNQRLQRAYKKYGAESFVYDILELVAADKEQLLAREQAWMDDLQPAYNLRRKADSNLGWVPSAETLRRRGLGMKRAWADPEKRANLLNFTRAGTAALIGKALSPERRQQVSESTRAAYANNPTVRENLVAAMTGKLKSPSHRVALSASAATRWQSDDYRTTWQQSRKEDHSTPGTRHRSAEIRAKISASKTGQARPDVAAKNADPEYQARCKAGRDAYWARKAAERQAAGLRTRSKHKSIAE